MTFPIIVYVLYSLLHASQIKSLFLLFFLFIAPVSCFLPFQISLYSLPALSMAPFTFLVSTSTHGYRLTPRVRTFQSLWKLLWRNSQNAKIDLPYNLAMPLLVFVQGIQHPTQLIIAHPYLLSI